MTHKAGVIAELLCFAFVATLCDWLKKLAPPFQPIRCKTNTNRDLVTSVFPRLAPVKCFCFEFSLVPCVAVCCRSLWLLWFWFYDTQMKTALKKIPLTRRRCHLHWNDSGWPNLSARAYGFSFLSLYTLHFNIRALGISSQTGLYPVMVMRSKLNVCFEQSILLTSLCKKYRTGFLVHSDYVLALRKGNTSSHSQLEAMLT